MSGRSLLFCGEFRKELRRPSASPNLPLKKEGLERQRRARRIAIRPGNGLLNPFSKPASETSVDPDVLMEIRPLRR
jgi:hypothetical protein